VLAASCSGCVLAFAVPSMISEMATDDASGLEFHRHEGTTRYGEAYRVRYLLDVGARRRWKVVTVAGRVVESGWEDVSGDLEAGARLWGAVWAGRTEGEVRREFGVPAAVSEVGDARTLWYVRGRREVYGVVLRDGLLVTAFRISEPEFDRLRAPSPPY
jgi:hypothetical protein